MLISLIQLVDSVGKYTISIHDLDTSVPINLKYHKESNNGGTMLKKSSATSSQIDF